MEGFVMKQIINGKMYNTETATEIATRSNGLHGLGVPRGDIIPQKKTENSSYVEVAGP